MTLPVASQSPLKLCEVHQADERGRLQVAGDLFLRTQRPLQALLSLGEVAALDPEPPEAHCQRQSIGAPVRIGEAPVDRGPEVVVLHVQPIEPGRLVRSDDLRFRLSCERQSRSPDGRR